MRRWRAEHSPLPPAFASRYLRIVFWLSRPPYLQWAGAVLIVIAAFVWDLRGRGGMPYPFAGRAISAGEPFEVDTVEFRTIPRGLMKPVDLRHHISADG